MKENSNFKRAEASKTPHSQGSFAGLVEGLPHVGKTLFVPLAGRAQAERFGIPLNDPKAVKIYQDFQLHKEVSLSPTFAMACVLRARAFDEWAMSSLAQQGVLISLGAGLCTRHQRLGRDSIQAPTFEVDFPEIIDLKKRLYGEAEGQHFIPSNILDEKWALEIKASLEKNNISPNRCFITLEGVCMYLTDPQFRSLLVLLQKHFPHADFAFDYIHPFLASKAFLVPAVKKTASEFHFGIRNLQKFCAENQLSLHTQKSLIKEVMLHVPMGKLFQFGPWTSLYQMAWVNFKY